KAGYIYEPSLDQIREMVKQLKAERPVPGNSVQITGGEPCLRDDLPEIIRILKEEGVDHIQLNTNGIRLAHDFEFFKRVKEAGVSNLYMSFDGVTPRTNPKNHWEVPKTLENARKLGVGVVLVPTVIKSVNDHELGDIIRFGFQNIDVVRAVNFQPVSLTGRMPKKEREKYRITIPDCIHRIEEQTNGEIPSDAWFPVPACTPLTNFIEALTRRAQYELSIHFACGAGTYVFKDHDKLIPITNFVDVEGLIKYLQDKTEEIEAGKNRFYIALKVLANISKYINTNKQPTGLNLKHMLYNIIIKHDYHSVGDWHRRSLFLGMMHFMDPYNHDEERLRRCDIHYLTPDMRIIPFCAFNVIPHWYRDRIQAMYGIPIAEWERRTGRKLKDDFYKRQLPSKQQAVPMASTKTAGFGGLKEVPVIQGGSGKEENCGPSCGCSH
ncbi:MAG: radical SAM protein, partial [Candidatus Caldarchaeum sp.]